MLTMAINERRKRQRGFYTRSDVARLLGISPQAMSYQVRQGYIPLPSRGPARRKYFSREDVMGILRDWFGFEPPTPI